MMRSDPTGLSGRREFLQRSGLMLGFTLGAQSVLLTPAQAAAEKIPLSTLTDAEAETLAAIAEALVPGARDAGIVHFVDHQLSAPPEEALLMVKYLGVPPAGLSGFYRGALAGADAAARARFSKLWPALNAEQAAEMMALLNGPDPEGWTGPPAGFFSFALRADACDVVYGTEVGFEKLGVPYMAHIAPPSEWQV